MRNLKFISMILLLIFIQFGECIGNEHIQDTSQVRILTTEEPPTNYTFQDKLVGTTIDIIEEIKRLLNLNVRIEVKPWARSYKIAKEEPGVVIFTAGRTQERVQHGFYFIGPVITRKHALWCKKGKTYNVTSINDIKAMNLNIGSMRGDWRTKFFLDQGIKVQEVANHELNLVKLLKGRFHLWVSSDVETPPILKKLGYDMDVIEIAYVFKEAESYIMLSKDTSKDIVEKWQNAFATIQKSDFFEKASKKWSDILGFELGYSKEKGFFVKQ
jgi:ABC-type amino acid transport substrate-binding protein